RIKKYFETFITINNLPSNSTLEEKVKPFHDLVDYFYQEKIYIKCSESYIKNIKDKIVEATKKGLKSYDKIRLQSDIIGAIACCIVAGNLRRSAVILISKTTDYSFKDLKNMDINPERYD